MSGSSFAADAVSRREASFQLAENSLDAEEAQKLAETRLVELDRKGQLLIQASQSRLQAVTTELANVLGETQLAAQVGLAFAELFQDRLNFQLAALVRDAAQYPATAGLPA